MPPNVLHSPPPPRAQLCKRSCSNKHTHGKLEWLSMKNRSPRRSTPRHPIAMASTAKPPDPWPRSYCRSCAHTAAICFRDQPRMHAGAYVLGTYLRTGCAHAAWAGGGSRSDALGAWRLCLAPRVGGGLWSSPAHCGMRLVGGSECMGDGGPDGALSSHGAESVMR
jgi:hypothetical protein